MVELSVIRHLCDASIYAELRDSLGIDDFTKEVQSIVRVLDTHMSDDEPTSLTVDDLRNLYFTIPRRDVEFYEGVFDALKENNASIESTKKLINGLRRAKQLRELSILSYEAAEGRKPLTDVTTLLKELEAPVELSDEPIEFVSDDLEYLVNERQSAPGLRWRLRALNESLGSIRKGNFGFVFARPETGKTTFLASEVSYMASQLGGDSGPILWFNNEQVGSEVMLRIYQSTLGIDNVNLIRDIAGNRRRYLEQTNGKIKLIDQAATTWQQVEKICAKYQPSLVVFDQIDKIKGFDADREDLRLGSIYIWARELAKQYCPVIGVCQADGSGEGQRWLTMANVANAKTSKQAEADWILGIGKIHDAGYDNLRYLHISKNKLWGDDDSKPELKHGRLEVLIEPQIGRYRDI